MTRETDCELLELAAKAAGLQECGWMADTLTHVVNNQFVFWSPLTDDGACARLEAALEITVEWYEDLVVSMTKHHAFGQAPSAHGGDKQAARRMATLQVAAAIGKVAP